MAIVLYKTVRLWKILFFSTEVGLNVQRTDPKWTQVFVTSLASGLLPGPSQKASDLSVGAVLTHIQLNRAAFVTESVLVLDHTAEYFCVLGTVRPATATMVSLAFVIFGSAERTYRGAPGMTSAG